MFDTANEFLMRSLDEIIAYGLVCLFTAMSTNTSFTAATLPSSRLQDTVSS